MKLTEKQWLWGLAGAAAVGWLAYFTWSAGGKAQPNFYLPGQHARLVQGQLIILRLPRGNYTMVGGGEQVFMQTQSPVGINTDVVLQIGAAPNTFTAIPTFINADRPGRQFDLTITASPATAAVA